MQHLQESHQAQRAPNKGCIHTTHWSQIQIKLYTRFPVTWSQKVVKLSFAQDAESPSPQKKP